MNLQPFTFVMQRCRPADFGWKIEFINLKKVQKPDSVSGNVVFTSFEVLGGYSFNLAYQ